MAPIGISENDYLRETSLASLHAESCEWKSEIDFWNEEKSFFYKLIHQRQRSVLFPSADLTLLDKTLISVITEKLGRLRERVISHELMLGRLMKNTSLNEDHDYRQQHRDLRLELRETQGFIRKFKRQVYSFV